MQHDLMVSSSLQFIIFQVVFTQRWKKLGCLLSPIYFNTTLAMCIDDDVMMTLMTMACRHIPNVTKSHHGGEMSVMIKVGMCQFFLMESLFIRFIAQIKHINQ